MFTKLNEPVRIGSWDLRSRTAMAPLTRCFAVDQTGVVSEASREYYTRRAEDGIGLIISEGTVISLRGKGIIGVPGIYTEDQIDGWKRVTESVRDAGGTMICQIWHVGRLTNQEITHGEAPQAPSAIPATGMVSRLRKPYGLPEAMSREAIKEIVGQFKQAAKNALVAGFDGVEIHGAHGYLVDQFNSAISNQRTDEYGGTITKRLTFMKEVLLEVVDAVGADKTVIRFSPHKVDNLEYMWDFPEEMVQACIDVFKEVGLQTLHPSAKDFSAPVVDGMTLHQMVRKYWDGMVIGVGELTPQRAEEALLEGIIDVAAFGRPLIANPDFLQKINRGERLVDYDARQHLAVLK